MSVHVFTSLLSRSACGVEHPLTLSCTQRNDSAWYMTLGNGEEKAKARAKGEAQRRAAEEMESQAKREIKHAKERLKGVKKKKEGVRDEHGMRT